MSRENRKVSGLGGLDPDELLRAAAVQGEDEDFFFDEDESDVFDRIRDVLTEALPDFVDYERLGRGGMGVVFRARHVRLGRDVAVKVLLPTRVKPEEMRARFEREAKALAQLQHPNIVTVHDYGEADGYPYLVMEFVDGASLRDILESGRFRPEEALALVPEICEALAYAHDKGVVHRDIKPENILVDRDGRLKIADFGIAKIAEGPQPRHRLTRSRMVMGTPHYMAPEQAERPQEVDHRADIYSLGVVFYEMLTGELPVGVFPPPSKKVQVDVRLDEVVLRSLEKEPDLRYQTVREVKRGISRAGDLRSVERRPASPRPGASRSAEATPLGRAAARKRSRTTRRAIFLVLLFAVAAPILGFLALLMILSGGALDGPWPFDEGRDSGRSRVASPSETTTVDDRTAGLLNASARGDLNAVKVYVAAGADVNAANEAGETAIFCAIAGGQAHVVEYLLDLPATDVRRRDGRSMSVLGRLVEFGDPDLVTKIIEDRSVDPNEPCTLRGETPMTLAWNLASLPVIQALAWRRARLSPELQTRATLETAVEKYGTGTAAQMVYAFGEAFRDEELSRAKRGLPTLVDAQLLREDTGLAYVLLHTGFVSGRFWARGYTALHTVAAYGRDLLMRPLMQAGGRLDARDQSGETPLMAAIRSPIGNDLPTIIWILEQEAARAKDVSSNGQTPMDIAVEVGHRGAIAHLEARGIARSPSGRFADLYRRYLGVQEAVGADAPKGQWREMAKILREERDYFESLGWPATLVFGIADRRYEVLQPRVWYDGMLAWAIARDGAQDDFQGALALPLVAEGDGVLIRYVNAKAKRKFSLQLVGGTTVVDDELVEILSCPLFVAGVKGERGTMRETQKRTGWWL